MVYLTAKELSEKWNISTRRICILCKEGRITGAVKKGNTWMIPKSAIKPDDGRKTEIKKGIIPLYLLLNPTYFEGKSIRPSEEDVLICEIQEKFFTGKIKEAYEDTSKALNRCKDNRYKIVYYFLKFLIGTDLGNSEDYSFTYDRFFRLLKSDEELKLERVITELYGGNSDGIIYSGITEEEYEELLPIASAIISKNSINAIMKNQEEADVSCYEIICHEIEKRDCPLISAYIHLYLAVFYNIVGKTELFKNHYNKALNILLPRKWYVPLAEYSLTVDLKYIEQFDKEAYKEVEKLSETIICSYMKVGLFNRVEYQHINDYGNSIQVGYKLFQGKSYKDIALELGISQYKAKKQIEELFSILRVNSKKELKEAVLKNCFI